MKEIRDRYDIFLKVCETGNFSRAAEALNYTQSGISQMMAGLEEEKLEIFFEVIDTMNENLNAILEGEE